MTLQHWLARKQTITQLSDVFITSISLIGRIYFEKVDEIPSTCPRKHVTRNVSSITYVISVASYLRHNASQSIATLETNGVEDDTRFKNVLENPLNNSMKIESVLI